MSGLAAQRWEARDGVVGLDSTPYIVVVEPDLVGDIVCEAPADHPASMARWPERARAIAALPELLAACKLMLCELGYLYDQTQSREGGSVWKARVAGREAIARAEGGAP